MFCLKDDNYCAYTKHVLYVERQMSDTNDIKTYFSLKNSRERDRAIGRE